MKILFAPQPKKIQNEGWGAKILKNLALDIKKEFPEMSGFSLRNLKYMRQFAECFSQENWAAAAAQIPWGHNIMLISTFKSQDRV